MKITCLSRVPNMVVDAIAKRLGVDSSLINHNKVTDSSKFDLVGLVLQMNAQNQKSFDDFTELDWEDFVRQHINEIMKSIDMSLAYDATSITFNIKNRGLSLNDYLSFINDNRDVLNNVVELTEDNKERIELLTINPVFQLFGKRLQQGFFGEDGIVYLSFPDLRKDIEKTTFRILQNAKSLNIPEEKKAEIYENYVKLMDRKREGKAITRDKFDFMFDNLQVYQNGDTYIFGEWDTKNNLFRGRLMSSPNIRQLYESLDLLFGNIPFMASVPEDIGKMLRKKGLYELQVDKPYNFRGEDMIKHLYFSDKELAERVFRKDVSEITYEDVENYDRFYNQYKLIQQLKTQFFSGDYQGLTRTLIDLGIYDRNAYNYVKKLRNGELTEKEKHDIIQHIISNTKSNKVNIESEDKVNSDLVYEKLNTEVNKILVKYLSKFGFKTEITQDLEKLGIDGYSTIQILNKIAYINENKQDNFPEEAGTVIAFMMQHNPLVTEIMKDMEKYSMFKKGVSKEERLQAVGDLIADELHKRTNEQAPQSLKDKIKNLIRQFLDFLHGIRLKRVNRNIGYIVDNIMLQNEALITQSMYKPGAIGEPLTRVTLEKALKSDKFGSDVIEKLSDYFVLTGSVAVAEQGTIYRPEKNLLHDIDWASPHSSEVNKRIFLQVFPDSKYIRQISEEGRESVTDTWLIVPEGYTIENLELEGDNNVIAYYDIVDHNGNIVNSYYNRKNSDGVRIENFTNDTVFGKTIDVFSNNERETFTSKTLSGKPLRLSSWIDTFRAKLEYSRLKDIWDYNRFIPNENLQRDLVFDIEELESKEEDNIYNEYDSVPIENTKDTRLLQLKDVSFRISDLTDKSKNKNILLNLLYSRGKYNSIIDLINSTSKSLKDRIADVEVVFDNVSQQRNKTLYGSYRGRRAYYDATDRKIHIDINAAYVDGDASSVIMHEIMHAVTLDLLKSNPEQAAKLRDIMKEYSEKVSSSRYDIEHGLEEFVADIWSNPKVIEQLKNTKADNSNMSLWDKIKLFFNNLFSGELFGNIKNDSLMAKASQELYQLLDMNADERQLGYYFENENSDANSISDKTADFGVELNKGGAKTMQSDAKKWQQNNPDGIVAYRKYKDTPKTFTPETVLEGWIGNPFSTESKGKDTVLKFYDWIVTGESFGETRATDEFREAVINKILSTPEDAKILYYTELNRPSHATVIGYLVRNKHLLRQLRQNTETRLQHYTSQFQQIIDRFKRHAIRGYDFETTHQYYVVVDENGNEFTKSNKSQGVVKFKDEGGNTRYGILVTKTVSQFEGEFTGNKDNKVPLILGNNFDSIVRAFFKGEELSYKNLGEANVEHIREQLLAFQRQLDEFFKDKGGYKIITDEFTMSGIYVDSKGNKNYIAGTMDMVVIGGDGSVYIYDMKTRRVSDRSKNAFLDVEMDPDTIIKYNNLVSIYKQMLQQELQRTGMEIKETGLIVCDLYYPKVLMEGGSYINYSVSKGGLVSVRDENGKLNSISNNIQANIKFNKDNGFIYGLKGLSQELLENLGIIRFESLTNEELDELDSNFGTDLGDNTEQENVVVSEKIDESDEINDYKLYIDSNQPVTEDLRPVSNKLILQIGIAAVKYVTYLAKEIASDSEGEFTKQFLGDKYATKDKKGRLPLYGKSILEILATDKTYKTLFRLVIIQFYNSDELEFGTIEQKRAQWIELNYVSILNNAFAELKSINGLKLNAHTLIFEYNEDSDELSEIYELTGEQLDQLVEAYDIDKRTIEFVQYMPRRLKQQLSIMPIYQYDENGLVVVDENGDPVQDIDENGMPKFIDIHYVSSFLTTSIGGMRLKSRMMAKMREMQKQNGWLAQVIDLLDSKSENYDEDFSKVFFKTFRKSKNNYISIYEQEENEYQNVAMRPLGANAKTQVLVDRINDKLLNGIHTTQSLLSRSQEQEDSEDTMVVNKDRLDSLFKMIEQFNKGNRRYGVAPKTDEKILLDILDTIGVEVDNEYYITHTILGAENARIGTNIYNALKDIYLILNANPKIRLSEPELSQKFRKLAQNLEFAMDTTSDVSVRDNDKSYQRYTEPSFIQDVIEEIKGDNLTEQEKKDSKGLPGVLMNPKSKYLRFRQFRRLDENNNPIFVNSWFNEIRKNPRLRRLLNHYVHTSTNGEQYMRQGDRDYLMSMIKAFFAPQEEFNMFGDFGPEEKNVSLFRIPIYSDKNSQEWISFKPIGKEMLDYTDDRYDRMFYSEFARAANEYFMYEIERMRDVLRQLRIGNPENDIANFNLKRIGDDILLQKYTITEDDGNGNIVQKTKYKELKTSDLLKGKKLDSRFAKSGFSFRYLSYLNEEIEQGTGFGRAVMILVNGANNLSNITEENGDVITAEQRFENAKKYVSDNFDSVFKKHMEGYFEQFIGMIDQMYQTENKKGRILHWYENEDFIGITQRFKRGNDALSPELMKRMMRWLFYNDNIAAMNIVNMTITDPAFNKDTIDFQKRFSQVYSLTQRLDKENEFDIDGVKKRYSEDGIFRFVIIDDEIVTSELGETIYWIFLDLELKVDDPVLKSRYKLLKESIPQMFDSSKPDGGVNVTDGQAYNSPTSLWKKMGMLGESNPQFNEAYSKIRKGDFSIGNINIVLQSLKPFAYGLSEQFDDSVYLGSEEQTKLVPVLLKDSESIILLAGAIMEGANVNHPLRVIYEFMEKSAFDGEYELKNYNGRGIDTVVFKSGVKVGSSGVLKISGKSYEEIRQEFEKCFNGDGSYNKNFVHELDFDAFGIQLNVPAHMQNHTQPLGSQMAVLDFTDMPEDIDISVDVYNPKTKLVETRTYKKSKDFIRDYNMLRKEDIGAGIYSLMTKFGCVKRNGKYVINKNKFNLYLSQKLSDKIVNDSKYSQELYRIFSQLVNANGNYEFIVPIGDPAIANVVYSTIFTEIRDHINKEDVQGGPVVQMSPFGLSDSLHIKDSNGHIVKIDKKTGKPVGFDYKKGLIFEAYITAPTLEFENKITKKDGSLMTMDEIREEVKQGRISQEEFDSATKFIAYRIPTEDKYSIYRCEVKGFIHRQEGELVILPKELTTLSGTDFDIDKLYCWFKMTNQNISSIKDPNKRTRYFKRNMMFDYHWAAAGHSSSVEKQLYPGGYDILKKLASDVNPGFKSGDLNIFMMQTQVNLRKLNAAGKNFVGIAALNNVCHGLASFCDLKLKTLPVFKINGHESSEYLNPDGTFTMDSVNSKFDGSRISRTLSMFVGASADNAKEALLGALNITPTTASYAMTLIRIGIPIDMVVYMMNAPLIKHLSSKAENEGVSFEKMISKEFDERKIGNIIYDITEDGLLDRINGNEMDPSVDNAVLKLLYDITGLTSDITQLNTLLSLNSIKNAIGPTVTDALKKHVLLTNFENNIKSDNSLFVKSTWDDVMNGIPFMLHLVDCYGSTISTLCQTFSPVYTAEFQNILNGLVNRGFVINEKNVRNLISQYLLFKGKVGGVFNASNAFLLTGMPTEFTRRRDSYKDNDFVRSLYIEAMKSKVGIPAIKYHNVDSTREQTDNMAASWAALASSKNEGSKNLSRLLFEYMITHYGFSWMPYSASSIAPVEAKLQLKTDEKHEHSYRDLFKDDVINIDYFQMSQFFDQFFRNNPKCGAFVISDSVQFLKYKDENGKYVPVIKESELPSRFYGFATKYYKRLFTVEKETLIGYKKVKLDDGETYVLLKEITRLGVDNNFAEYDPNGIETSIIDNAKGNSTNLWSGIRRVEQSYDTDLPVKENHQDPSPALSDNQGGTQLSALQSLMRSELYPFLRGTESNLNILMEEEESMELATKAQIKYLQKPNRLFVMAKRYFDEHKQNMSQEQINDIIEKINGEIENIKKIKKVC